MNLYELIQQRGIEAIGRFYSTYRGIVITNYDPDSQNKVCVYLPSILRGVEVWAYPKHQQGGPGSGFKWLSPREGSIVYVEFENGDPRHPLWSYHGWAVGEMPPELNKPNVLGFITPKGNKIILDESDSGVLTAIIHQDIIIKSLDGNINVDANSIIMQGGEVGIPESTSTVERLNKIEQDINNLKQAFTSWTPTPQDGGAALKTVVASWSGSKLTETKVEDIESETIKQPN